MLFPIFLPDATRGVIKSLDSKDIAGTNTEGVIVNTYHLMSQPGVSILKDFGGIKKLMNFEGWVISDSGGFQLLSLVYQNKSFGKITSEGVTFYRGSKGEKGRYYFTPEKSIQVQFDINPDILICLDDCPARKHNNEENKLSVGRTIDWAKRCKEEYLKQIESRKISQDEKPLLFGVIQGGRDKLERERCAKELIKIGFDGYCFGGWPISEQGGINKEMLAFTASLLPDNLPKYALGVGDPQAIVDCTSMGYNIFDTVLPTRDARHQRLYIFNRDPDKTDLRVGQGNFGFIYSMREKNILDNGSISSFCHCYTCQNYSIAYLYHLFKIEDSLASRLATIHNLWTYAKLIEVLRKYI